MIDLPTAPVTMTAAAGSKGSYAAAASKGGSKGAGLMNAKNSKPAEIRKSNINAAKALADAIRTSLGPKGMDKMIKDAKGNVTITNDGATILKQMNVINPCAKMLVELSQAQDAEAGDGTTSVVVFAGSLLEAAEQLLNRGIHPSILADSFQTATKEALTHLDTITHPVDIKNKEGLLKAAATSLNSKVVSKDSNLASLAVDAVMSVAETFEDGAGGLDLNDINVVTIPSGTVDDSELVTDGLVFKPGHFVAKTGGPERVDDAKIGLIQFCISPPKTDMDNKVVINDSAQVDRILREERQYILNICKKIKASGCNVLLIQKSILRDAVSDMALHFLSKLKIMVIKDIERDQIEFVSKTLGCTPAASLDHFKAEVLGGAKCVERVAMGEKKVTKVTGVSGKAKGKTASIILRGSNSLLLEEADRSLHDALCVLRCLVQKPMLVNGGGAPEIEVAEALMKLAKTMGDVESYGVKAFARALEVIPYTLAENAGLDPVKTVTELRKVHQMDGDKTAGINVKRGIISSMTDEHVLQPALVTSNVIQLASETVCSILKIDDIVNTIR